MKLLGYVQKLQIAHLIPRSVYTHGRPYAHGQSFALISYFRTGGGVWEGVGCLS